MFNQVMNACTENYECLVLDNTSKSNKIEDVVYWYKAALHKPFRAGHPNFWKKHNELYNPKHDADVELEMDSTKHRKHNQPIVNVKKTAK